VCSNFAFVKGIVRLHPKSETLEYFNTPQRNHMQGRKLGGDWSSRLGYELPDSAGNGLIYTSKL
jgi:hypothetical protein